MSFPEFSLEEEPEKLSLTDNPQESLPSPKLVQNRAEKIDYTLGRQSPGIPVLSSKLALGEEPLVRQQMALDEDIKYRDAKMSLISGIARNMGRDLSPDEIGIVQSLTQTEIKTDPSTVLEKKFAQKYVDDVTTLLRDEATRYHDQQEHEKDIATNIIAGKDYFQNQRDNYYQRWEETGWIPAIGNTLWQMIPFTSWWYQKGALENKPGVEFLLGNTLKANIQYLYALPFEQRRQEYAKAMEYLWSKNPLDALAFADGMVSFSTSEQYIANSVSLADYGTLGSFVGKTVGKVVGRGGKAATRAFDGDKIAAAVEREIPQEVKVAPEANPQVRYREPEQLDLFPYIEPKFNGQFDRVQQTPSLEAKLGPGKLRATHVVDGEKDFGRDIATGRIYKEPKQLDFQLPEPSHQYAMDLKAPEAIKETRQFLADVVKATEGPTIEPKVVLSQVGRVAESGVIGALERIAVPLTGKLDDLVRELPTFANPLGFFKDSKVIGREYAQRTANAVLSQGPELLKTFLGSVRGSRITAEALAVGKAIAQEALRKEYLSRPRFSDGVIDFIFTPAQMHPARVDTVTMRMGETTALPFRSKEQAEMWRRDIYKLGEKEAPVARDGDAWYLMLSKHVDETSDAVRSVWSPTRQGHDNMISNLTDRIMSGLDFLTGGRLRSADDRLSEFSNQNRKVATTGPQETRKAILDVIHKDIQSLPKQDRRELMDILKINRDMPSTTYPGERGEWFKTAGEFEQAFIERHKKPPTPEQVVAYDTYKRLSDFEWLTRNMTSYRDKARQGIETFRFRFTDAEGEKFSAWFEGKQHEKMPWSIGRKGDQDAGIYVWDAESKTGRYRYKYDMTEAEMKEIDELIRDKGYRAVQVFDPKKHPLEDVAKTREGAPVKDQINYVITNQWEKQPLQWNQVDYHPGVHSIYPHKWYVAQPIISEGRKGKLTYFGDNVALNVTSEAEARMWADRIDQGRILLKSGKSEELDVFLNKNLPYDRSEFEQLFFRKDSPFSLDHKVTIKEASKSVLETNPELKAAVNRNELVDSTRNIHDLSNFMDKSFLQDRDLILKTIDPKTRRLVNAEQLDPFEALQRAMNQSLRNVWLNDYKIQAVEEWIAQFKGVLKPSEDVLTSFPTYFLYRPQWADVSSSQYAELMSAKAAQRAIVNFLGTETELGSAVGAIKTKVQNQLFKTLGSDAAGATDTLAAITDPVKFLRASAFHTKLGFFNPVQYLLQAQSAAHSIAVAGIQNGMAGISGYMGMRMVAHNPEMLDTVANLMAKVGGWKASEFKELYETMRRTGVFQVAGEATLRDDVFDPKLFKSKMGWMLDAGAMFFNEGERATRLTAFGAAFKEFRAANPGVKIGDRELAQIMNRSDLLSVNMTRASNAAWQHGPMSVPTQFMAFNARLMEQMMGKRLTGAEKLRALATYSTLYGVPVGAGAAVGVWPVYDSIKEYAFANNINLNPAWAEGLTEGALSMALHYALGREYNVAQRFSPGNNTQIRDILAGDKKFYEILFGASGTILGDMLKTTRPFVYAAASIFGETGEYPITSSDWMNLFRNITTVDIAAKAAAVMAYGKWITKSGTEVGKADGMDAAMAVLGLTPMHISEGYMIGKNNKALEKGRESLVNDALENFRRGLQAAKQGDYNAQADFFKRAYTTMQAADLPWEDRTRIYQRALGNNMDYEDKVRWDAVKRAGPTRREQQLDQYNRNRNTGNE